MKRGFTLIELLAVIVILAIITLIAIPIVLDIIEDSKLESIRLSVEYYLDGVEESVANSMLIENKNYDGIYTVKDNGKLLSNYDNEIYVNYTGNGLEEGIVQIEDGKAVRLSKVKIRGYYAKLENDKVNLYKEINESTLVSGGTFNQRIKKFIDESATSNTENTGIVSITFLPDGMMPNGYTKASLEKLDSVDVSSKNDKSIVAYYDGEGNIYVYSDNYIYSNNNCTSMFYNNTNLKSISFNGLDTSRATLMNSMFNRCSSLKELDLSNFSVYNVTNMHEMFNRCTNLERIYLSKNFNTYSVKDMGDMFFYCNNLKELDLSSFDTKKVENMIYMFLDCKNLEKLDLSSFDVSSVTSMNSMFSGCNNLRQIEFSKKFNTSSVKTMSNMFNGCSSLVELDLSSFNTSQAQDVYQLFENCSSLEHIYFGNGFVLDNTESLSRMFDRCSSLLELDLSNFSVHNVTNIREMFNRCTNLRNVIFGENFDTSTVENMSDVFFGCESLIKLDLRVFDTSNVTNAGNMFYGCSSLEEIKVSSKWVINEEAYKGGMFTDCGVKDVTLE